MKAAGTLRKHKNENGFTLIELMMVMIILGILIQMSATFALDIRRRSFDAVALVDGKNLMTVASGAMIGLDDVDMNHTTTDGREIGVLYTDGTARSPIFSMSEGVHAYIDHVFIPNASYVTAYVYHENGTDDTSVYGYDGKRAFYFSIDEATNAITSPQL